MTRKLILLEVNEVPFRVLDTFCEQQPDSALARLLRVSAQYETYTEDRFALDPWISWPTLHRGVNDEQHNILHLGQPLADADEKYPPIWRLLKERNKQVGVFGSLHSSSLPADVRDYHFYLPDYFDTVAFAHPTELLPFQELNVVMTRDSARNVTRKIPLKLAAKVVASAPELGLKFSTVADSMMHLAREAFDRSLRIRRRAYQPLVTMDLFLRQMQKTKPDFATFYTNHVAAAMHRYWGAAFPQDYAANRLDAEWIRKHHGEIHFAMAKFDVMLTHLLEFIDENPEYALMVASSMGQAATTATQTHEFLTITDVAAFMRALGVPGDGWEIKAAMVPCCCVVVQEQYREQVASKMATVLIDGVAAKRQPNPAVPFSFDERERGFFQFLLQFDNYAGPETVVVDGQSMPLAQMGLGRMAHEDGVNCTAQHIPGGSLLFYAKGLNGVSGARPRVSTLDVSPSILDFFGLTKPTYMRGTASIRLNS